jgi:S1-C subfamily serine protease
MGKNSVVFSVGFTLCLLALVNPNIAIANDSLDLTKFDVQTQKQIKAACYFQKMESPTVYADCLSKETRKVFSSTKHRLKTTATNSSLMPNPKWSSSGDNAATNWGGRQTASSIYENLKGSVFKIYLYKSKGDAETNNFYKMGSGVAVSSNIVITNCHVALEAAVILLKNKQTMTIGKLIKANASKDACVLSVADPLTPVPTLREYSSLEIGETVYSLGSPKGLSNTFAEGNISGLRRFDNTNLIQTSAPISPGSSGGGLFDKAGNLVGITTFMIKGGNNLNFAVGVGEFWK